MALQRPRFQALSAGSAWKGCLVAVHRPLCGCERPQALSTLARARQLLPGLSPAGLGQSWNPDALGVSQGAWGLSGQLSRVL